MEEKIPSLEKILKKEDIKAYLFPRKKTNIKGLTLISSDKTTIYVRKRMTENSRRFMVGYMYCYHKLYTTEETTNHIFYDESIYDKKAYNETLKLLVPINMLKSDVKKGTSMEELSKKYQVSQNILLERIKLDNRQKAKSKLKLLKFNK